MIPLEEDEKTAVWALIAVVGQYVQEHMPPFTPRPQLPEGIRLEMHPMVRYMILRNWQPSWSGIDITEPGGPFPDEIPVKISPELPRYGWRLVVVTEDVINGGVMPHPGKERS